MAKCAIWCRDSIFVSSNNTSEFPRKRERGRKRSSQNRKFSNMPLIDSQERCGSFAEMLGNYVGKQLGQQFQNTSRKVGRYVKKASFLHSLSSLVPDSLMPPAPPANYLEIRQLVQNRFHVRKGSFEKVHTHTHTHTHLNKN